MKKLSQSAIKNVDCVQLDLTDDDSIKKSAKFVSEKYGKLDILVNNAGMAFKMKDGFNHKSLFCKCEKVKSF